MSLARTAVVASALLLLFPGCSLFQDDRDPPAPGAPSVDVPEFAHAPFFVPVGQSITFTAYLTADGKPLEKYSEFHWNGLWSDDGSEIKVEVAHPSPGVETVTLTPRVAGRFDVSALVLANEKSAHTRYVPVIAWGGTTTDLLPFQRQVHIVVGEDRPVAVFPAAQANSPFPEVRSLGDVPITYSVDDTAVASVSATGVVHGVSAGSTLLHFTANAISSSVPVTVTSGALGPPPDGVSSTDGLSGSAWHEDDGATLISDKGTHEQHLAIDSQGNPIAVVSAVTHFPGPLSSRFQGTVLVTRWTGSGLGDEWVNEVWDDAFQPRIVLDAADVAYVAYTSKTFHDVVVASRPAHGGPETWTRRRLPMDLAVAQQAGLVPDQYTFADDRIAMFPRVGGGVWVAYRAVDDFRYQSPEVYNVANLATPGTCAEVIKLAEVTDAAVTVHDVRVRWYDVAVDPKVSCGGTPDEQMPLHLLPPAPGEQQPRILSVFSGLLELFEPKDGAWASSELGKSALQLNGFYGPTFVAVARPDNATDPVVLLSYDERLPAPLPAGVTWNALPGLFPINFLAYGGTRSAHPATSASSLRGGSTRVPPSPVRW